jgi:hypothetical protein
MSYDLYCYLPTSDIPNLNEAEALVEGFDEAEESEIAIETTSIRREAIVAALLSHNPRLERFQFDYQKIASSLGISETEARARYQHAELTPPEGDLAIQLTVHDDHVFIAIPYWYKGSRADQLFVELSGYLKVIRESAGFFVFDPQTGTVWDPKKADLQDRSQYDRIVKDLPAMLSSGQKQSKPWWRFW